MQTKMDCYRSISVDFAERAVTNNKMMGMVFAIHTIFRIGEVIFLGDNTRLVQVQVSLASDKDNDLC
jgi:hypothetical protein